MPVLQVTQSILTAALGEYKNMGFSLTNAGDNIAKLYFKEKEIAALNIDFLTIPKLQECCRNFLKNTAGY